MTHEQQESMHKALSRASILHGDHVDVKMAVGTLPSTVEPDEPHFAQCSAEVKVEKVVLDAGPVQHELPIAGKIVYENTSVLRRVIAGRSGIAFFRARIETNGDVHVRVREDSVGFMPVPKDRLADLRNYKGQELSQQALQLLS